MVTFVVGDPTMTKTVALTADTDVEGTEYFDFIISLSHAATVAAASVATADTAEVFILDLSCK